ncbi:DUF2971 domain-containing protein [Psychrobacter immobilis]|uniref:DUF2971 domain-containing protein n=1 Tax=Psychrobacter immobilis TaxID=498 RepID=UPI00191B5175|nr:DUF2971 domain-containing protein [Psychrobacter immobilis]
MEVYKYRTLNEDNIDSLKENYFWAASKKTLNDPYEGTYSTEMIDDFFEKISSLGKIDSSKDLRESFNSLEKKISECSIFSLSKDYAINSLWAYYADNHKGICIEYDLEELISKNVPMYQHFDINYVDNPLSISMNDVISENIFKITIGTKELSWSNEQEYRIISDIPEKNYHRSDAIKSIFFGLQTSKDEKENLMQILANRNIQFKQICKDNNCYKLSSYNINNPFDVDNKVTEIEIPKYIVPEEKYVKDEYKEYIPYLYKVAQFMLSYSDCLELHDINFSQKSTIENPIIYANFKEKNSIYYSRQKLFSVKSMGNNKI